MKDIKIGDIVFCIETGARGKVVRIYKPTGAEEQAMIQTDDTNWLFHAPLSEYKIYEPFDRTKLSAPISAPITNSIKNTNENDVTAQYEKYKNEFAENHSISEKEAENEPMVKAYKEYLEKTDGGRNFINLIKSGY